MIRNPEITKKMSTPIKPALRAGGRPKWNSTTRRTATALNPSISARCANNAGRLDPQTGAETWSPTRPPPLLRVHAECIRRGRSRENQIIALELARTKVHHRVIGKKLQSLGVAQECAG